MRLKFFLCFTFFYVACFLSAQNNDLIFRRISPPGGFTFQAIHSFNQDQYGYMWMGGFDGVFRYNSKDVVRFTYHPENVDGLPSNTVTSIAIDKQNGIWASTNKGLCKFNHMKQTFERIRYTYEDASTSNDNLFSIQIDKAGRLWIADEYFFGYWDKNDNRLRRITKGLSGAPRLVYYNAENDHLWLGTLDGSVFFIDRKEMKAIKKIEGPGSVVRTICSSRDHIWVGYQKHGARMYDFEGTQKKHYAHPEYDLASASVRKIWRNAQDDIWIGSYYGLFRSRGENLKHLDHAHYEGLPHNSIFDIYEDRQGGIWIGTWSGGIAYLHHSDNKFINYRHSKEPGSISDNMISSFVQTQNGDLYIGSELFGLNHYEPATSKFTPIQVRASKGVLDIKAMLIDEQDGFWIASAFNGVFYRRKGTKRFMAFNVGKEDGKHVSMGEIYSLCSSDSGVWIGTNLGGLNFYNFKTKKISFKSKEAPFSKLLSTNIRSIFVDSRENMWLSTFSGIYKIHLPSKKLTIFNIHSPKQHKTRSQTFYFAQELSDNKIWIGSGGDGAYVYHPESDSISHFDANGLLENKDVYGIIEGIDSTFWITSNDGLVLHDIKEGSSRRFVMNDGIQGNLFNPNAIFKDKDGNLYFGGTNGFSKLEPQPININRRAPNILLNGIRVNNQKIIPKQTGVNAFEKIVLEPEESSFTFDFSADNYLLPDKNEFTYRLTNYVNDWVESGSNSSASFVNVPAGEYTFEVKACNNDGIWNENPANIKIVIQQFWYKSTVAIIFYSIVLFFIMILIMRFYHERSELKKALLLEKMEHRQEEQLHEMKLKFFTNVSHEFRTPLTLINGPVTQLSKADNLTDLQHRQLDTVKRNTNRLLQLINQIMDLRKAEKGLEKLNVSQVELVGFINEQVLNFSEEAKAKNIRLTFNAPNEGITIEADEEKLDKIIYNLLSNAFKYTPKNKSITVGLRRNKITTNGLYQSQLSFGNIDNEDFVEITVEDSGQGISDEDLPHILNRFEQGKTKSKVNSTGIGLNLCKDYTLMHRGAIIVQSTEGKGTRFSIQIPDKQKAQEFLYQSHEQVKNINLQESAEVSVPQTKIADEQVNILVVEDNNDLQAYIAELLEKYYRVSLAKNGKQALKMLTALNIDLIISDVMMPEMDGFEFCQSVKSQIETSHIPVILLTALSSSESVTAGLDKGADAYIPKPFDERMLLTRINNLLEQRKRLQENFAQRLVGEQPIALGSLDSYLLRKINAVIEKNIENEGFTVDILAAEVALSRSQLHRKLKEISNHSASEYINIVKVKKATELLRSKSYNIDEVAFRAGFNSHTYFTKCFKKVHEQTPKAFLKGLE